ncbi:MAG: filamentous hemagglutinin N-terminal domain-containing protein, partial [Alphaproteobacteria bacterium]|nr:filamentous hemagglutinin N-terminal domain-containing protein [Alphaproteobacteria bacterium]
AAPVGGIVASGSATISVSGSTTTITQTTDRAAIDWTSFNLSAAETANFTVPASSSATLNRITGGGVSTISGTVTSNGAVYFVNPNGMVFDATSRVSANGFIASTAGISNDDFIAQREVGSSFGTGSLLMNGTVTAPTITATAATISVGGSLTAPGGAVLIRSNSQTTVGLGAVISADAGATGKGGSVKILSDGFTDFLGAASARGGTLAGDGGFVEVSGHRVNLQGSVNTLAVNGVSGQFLLDPADIMITATGLPPSGVNSDKTFISANSLVNYLNTNGNYSLVATNSIEVAEIIGSNGSWTNGNSLTLEAGSIILSKSIIASGSGSSVVLKATGLTGEIVLNGTDADFKIKANDIDFKAGQSGNGKITAKGTVLHFENSGAGSLSVRYDGVLPERTSGSGLIFQFDSAGSFVATHSYVNSNDMVYDSGVYYTGSTLTSTGERSSTGSSFGMTAGDYQIGVRSGVDAPVFTAPTVNRVNLNLGVTFRNSQGLYDFATIAARGLSTTSIKIGRNAIVTAPNGGSYGGALSMVNGGQLRISGSFTLTASSQVLGAGFSVATASGQPTASLILRPQQGVSLTSALSLSSVNLDIDLGSSASLTLGGNRLTSAKDVRLILAASNPNGLGTTFANSNSQIHADHFVVQFGYLGNQNFTGSNLLNPAWLLNQVVTGAALNGKTVRHNVVGSITLSGSFSQNETLTREFNATGGITLSTAVSLANGVYSLNAIGAIGSSGLTSLTNSSSKVNFTAGGLITLSATGLMNFGGNLTAAGAISLTAGSLSLTSNVLSDGGDVTLDLGTGLYTNNGFSWNTSGKNLSLIYGGADIAAGTVALILTKDNNSGVFNQKLNYTNNKIRDYLNDPTTSISTIVFTNDGLTPDNPLNESMYFAVSDIPNIGIVKSQTDITDATKFTGDNPLFSDLYLLNDDGEVIHNIDVQFHSINYTERNIGLVASSINFKGMNSFKSLNLHSNTTINETLDSNAAISTTGAIELKSEMSISLGGKNNFAMITGFSAPTRVAINTVNVVLNTTEPVSGTPIEITGETFTLLRKVKSGSSTAVRASKTITIKVGKVDSKGTVTSGGSFVNNGNSWTSTNNQSVTLTLGSRTTSNTVFNLGQGTITQNFVTPYGVGSKPVALFVGPKPLDSDYNWLTADQISSTFSFMGSSEVVGVIGAKNGNPANISPSIILIKNQNLSTIGAVINSPVILSGSVNLGTGNGLQFARDVTVNSGSTVTGNLKITAGNKLTIISSGSTETEFISGSISFIGDTPSTLSFNGNFR